MSDFAERLRTERTRARLTQAALAASGISSAYVSLLESGQRAPTAKAAQILSARLDVTADYLLAGHEAPSEVLIRQEIAAAAAAMDRGETVAARDMLLAMDIESLSHFHRHQASGILARAHETLGDLEKSLAVLEPMRVAATTDHRDRDAAVVAMSMVAVHLELGAIDRAIDIGEAALVAAENVGLDGTDEHLRLASTVLWAYLERGDLLHASKRADQLSAIAQATGSELGQGSVYWNAALIAAVAGHMDKARETAERAIERIVSSGSTNDLSRLRYDYGWLLLRTAPADPRAALAQFSLAGQELRLTGSVLEVARLSIETGRALLMMGIFDRAEEYILSGLDRLGQVVNLDTCEGHVLLGDVASFRGDHAAAEGHYTWAATRLAMMSSGRRAGAVWQELGVRRMHTGDPAGAVAAFREALDAVGVSMGAPIPARAASRALKVVAA